MGVCPTVPLDADAFHRKNPTVDAVRPGEFRNFPFIRGGDVERIVSVRKQKTDAESRPREGMSPNERVRNLQLLAEHPDFVLVKIRERFDELSRLEKFENFVDAVVVRFDFVRIFRSAAFDGVRVDGSLGEHPFVRIQAEGFHFAVLDVEEGLADDRAFFFRERDSFERLEKILGGVDHAEVLHSLPFEKFHDLGGFVEAHHPVVDMETEDVFWTEDAVQQNERHRGIDSARDQKKDLFALDLFADALRYQRKVALHVPRLFATAVADEIFEDLHPELAVGDFRVELESVDFPFGAGDRGDLAVGGARDYPVSVGKFRHAVPMAHPHRGFRGDAFENRVAFVGNFQVGDAVFLDFSRFDLSSELGREKLVAVTNAELRNGNFKNFRIVCGRVVRVDARGTAAVNDSLDAFQFLDACRGGVDFGKDSEPADPVRYQVRVLSAEVENGDGVDVFHASSPSSPASAVSVWTPVPVAP